MLFDTCSSSISKKCIHDLKEVYGVDSEWIRLVQGDEPAGDCNAHDALLSSGFLAR